MIEEWRDVIGFETEFKVSNQGNVFSKRTNRLLKQTKLKTGYWSIATRIGGRTGKCICFRVHRLVAEAFLPPPSQELITTCAAQGHGKVLVRHLDDVKTNNFHRNLAWGTYADNSMDWKLSAGYGEWIVTRGKLIRSRSTLSISDAQFIRDKYKAWDKNFGMRALARRYGVAHSSIYKIIVGICFKSDLNSDVM